VRRYLNEFLMDPHVIDLPWPLRRLLVSCFVLPIRPRATAMAYRSIWQEAGAPLVVNTHAFAAAVNEFFPGPVRVAMRYGQPDIASTLGELAALTSNVIVVPLYPHYARSTVFTTLEAVNRTNVVQELGLAIRTLPPFFSNPAYISCLAQAIRPHVDDVDLLLFSYHGLPERHVRKADPTGSHCLRSPDCCEQVSEAQATCYRYQVKRTTELVARDLGLAPERYRTSFQSRLGRAPWLRPYTSMVLAELPRQGVKRLAVVCPAFLMDNLETLEEIDMQGREIFLDAGGESFTAIPCLNDSPSWVQAFAALCRDSMETFW